MLSFLTALRMRHMATPSTPSSGSSVVYFKSDGNLYMKNSTGVETQINNGTAIPKIIHTRGLSANQGILSSVSTAVTYDTVIENTGGITYSAGAFTLPAAGVYQVTANVAWAPTGSPVGRRIATISVNGTTKAYFESFASSTSYTSCAPTLIQTFASGDVVRAEALHTQGAGIPIYGDATLSQSRITIVRLS